MLSVAVEVAVTDDITITSPSVEMCVLLSSLFQSFYIVTGESILVWAKIPSTSEDEGMSFSIQDTLVPCCR